VQLLASSQFNNGNKEKQLPPLHDSSIVQALPSSQGDWLYS